MPLFPDHRFLLRHFYNTTAFAQSGAVITDLDGTAIHEWSGGYGITTEVELGLKAVYATGRPIVLNTLRFPLSVMRTFGQEWYRISRSPIPTVLLNGSLLGYIHEDADGIQRYEELAAFPLREDDITGVLQTVRSILDESVLNLLVFYYPRDWRRGEIIWTPVAGAIPRVQEKYRSAEHVWSSDFATLREALREREHCMVFLHADAPDDKKMAYQHSARRDFFTRPGVDKLSGAREIAALMGFSLEDSLCAGDTAMDSFLRGAALAVHVGVSLEHHGRLPSLVVKGGEEFGALLMELAALLSGTQDADGAPATQST